jgi:hypothetical protein
MRRARNSQIDRLDGIGRSSVIDIHYSLLWSGVFDQILSQLQSTFKLNKLVFRLELIRAYVRAYTQNDKFHNIGIEYDYE